MRKDNLSVKNVKTINTQTGEVKQRRVETTTLDEKPSIWNLQAFVIVFLFIMLGTTINVYSVNNDNLTWIDSNGDFKINSYDHSMINLNTPIVELNNQSLNEVFNIGNVIQNHDFSNGITNWSSMSRSSLSIVDGNLRVSSTVTGSDYYFTRQSGFPGVLNEKFYYYFQYRVNDLTDISFIRFVINGNQVPYQHTPTTTDWIQASFIESSYLNNFRIDSQYTEINNKYYEINGDIGIYAVNMSDLGIDNLTKNQMDEYYNLYVNLQENRIEAYKDLGNEPISQWQNLTQTVSSLIDDILQPVNDVNDWINKFMQGLFS